jgi:non-ribosomal peptide synthetase component F
MTPQQADQAEAVALKMAIHHTESIQALAQRIGCTPFMVLLAAYEAVYSWWTGCEDTIIGIPVAGRSHADLQRTTGLLLNVVPLRGRQAAGLSFAEWLAGVKQRLIDVLHHSNYPAELLVEELDEQGLITWEPTRHPLFDTLFVMQDITDSTAGAGGLCWQPVSHNIRAAKLDLAVQVEESDGAYVLTFEYRSALFLQAAIQRLAAYMEQVLAGAVEAPDAAVLALISSGGAAHVPTALAADESQQESIGSSAVPDLFEDAFDF